MDSSNVNYYVGSLTDNVFCHPKFALIVATNSVTCKNFGIVKSLAEKFPYGDVTVERRPSVGRNYACALDREQPGRVITKTPVVGINNNPTIVTLISQYGIGLPLHQNMIAERDIKHSPDELHVRELKRDSLEKRIRHFGECIYNLQTMLSSPDYAFIEYLVLPLGIGFPGRFTEVWLNHYFPMIQELADYAIHRGKQVILAVPQDCHELIQLKLPVFPAIYSQEMRHLKVIQQTDMEERGEDIVA